MKAVLCPVCNGGGVLCYGIPCHGCAEWGSKGWLLIPEQEDLPSEEPYWALDEPIVPLDDRLIEFYKRKGYDVCPACGRERRETALTGCPPGSHYGGCSIPDGNDTIADDTNDTYSDPHGTVFTY